MDYQEALAYIHGTLWQGSRLGLERIRELTNRMGRPQDSLKFIHIAGTNGKGSSAAMLASVFQQAGYLTGLYTSPFISRFTERIRVNGREITGEELGTETEYVKPFSEAMADHPTEFELVTAIALSYFVRKKCDIVIWETGMGGALDSTNVIGTPELAVITAIGMDHRAQLGNTLEEITRTKAGIIKPGGDVAAFTGCASVERILRETCRANNAHLRFADLTKIKSGGYSDGMQRFDFDGLKELRLSLWGDYQLENAALVLTGLDILAEKGWHIEEAHIRRGLETVKWPARFERIAEDPPFFLDGGHNPQGTAAAATAFAHLYPNQRAVILMGVMGDKDIDAMLAPLFPIAACFVTVTAGSSGTTGTAAAGSAVGRAMSSGELAKRIQALAPESRVIDGGDIENGAACARNLAREQGGAVLAVGSLYMAGRIRDFIMRHPRILTVPPASH